MNSNAAKAVAMWDFFRLERRRLERRRPGAGYEDRDAALDELVGRGYNAVRIDAYPHLCANDPTAEYFLDPHWVNMSRGSPALNRVQVQPSLNRFIQKCAERDVAVALSTWWREDKARPAERIKTPQQLGAMWTKRLDAIAADGLLEHIEFVDFSNEFPIDVWTPLLPQSLKRNSAKGKRRMSESIDVARQKYADLHYCFFIISEYESMDTEDVSFMDSLELHCRIVHWTDFYPCIGYEFTCWGNEQCAKVVQNGEKEYRTDEQFYKDALKTGIHKLADWSRTFNKPLATTEC